jgi:hypothetical protein
LNVIDLLLGDVQEGYLLCFHEEVKGHGDDPVATESFHGFDFLDDVGVLGPVLDQKAEEVDFRNPSVVRDDLAVDDGGIVAGGDVHFVDLQVEVVSELLLEHLHFKVGDGQVRKIVDLCLSKPVKIQTNQSVLDLLKDYVSCLSGDVGVKDVHIGDVDVVFIFEGKFAPEGAKGLQPVFRV